jgi:hypothetical protein
VETRHFEKFAVELAGAFVRVTSDKIDEEINRWAELHQQCKDRKERDARLRAVPAADCTRHLSPDLLTPSLKDG